MKYQMRLFNSRVKRITKNISSLKKTTKITDFYLFKKFVSNNLVLPFLQTKNAFFIERPYLIYL